jgi:hypothetical protein
MLCLAGALLCATAFPQDAGQSTSGSRPLGFSAMSRTGKRMFVRDLVVNGPAFLYFIRHGDNVNNQFARELGRIQNAYGTTKTKWYGIINADRSRTDSWIAEIDPAYEVLMDPELSLVQLYGVESSPALLYIGADGQIIKQWMGYSGFWLKDINKFLADVEGVEMKKLDFSRTPSSTRYGAGYIIRKQSG